MKNLKLHTPTGFKDLLHEEYLQKRAVEETIAAIFSRYGYSFVSSPSLEYLQVFEERGDTGEMYKFIDRNGDTLALRPDMTPAAARIAATYDFEMPLRLCYIEKAFRHHEYHRGYENEFTQAGAELIGHDSAEADAETIALAMHILQAAGLKKFRIDLGHVDFLPGVLRELSGVVSEEASAEITQAMLVRDYAAAEELAKNFTANCGVKAAELLRDLMALTGGAEVLERAESLTTNLQALAAITHLQKVFRILEEQGFAENILFDLGMIGRLNYYTGIIFKGYAKGSGMALVDGGRYKMMDCAVGFGMKVEGVLEALKAADVQFDYALTETLLVYEESMRKVALTAANAMRRQGLNIENSLKPGQLEEQKSYAKTRGLKGILYFGEGEKIKLINLVTDDEAEITLDELL